MGFIFIYEISDLLLLFILVRTIILRSILFSDGVYNYSIAIDSVGQNTVLLFTV